MRRIVVLSLFLLCICVPAYGRAKYSDYAQKGGKNVKTSTTVTYKLMETYPSCTITVYLGGTTTLATIYSNSAGTIKANPFVANADSYFEFYADNGLYDIKFSGLGILVPFTKGNIILSDPLENYDPLAFGAKCDNSTTDNTAFSLMLTTIGANFATINIPKLGPCRLNSITFPANVTMDFSSSGGLYANTGQTITLNGMQTGPEIKRFYNALGGQGTIIPGGKNARINVTWWSTTGGDGSATDNSTEIVAALNAAASYSGVARLYFPKGKWRIGTQIIKDLINLQSSLIIEGDGSSSHIIFAVNNTQRALTLSNGESVTIQNLVFSGTGTGSEIWRGISFQTVLQAKVLNCHFYGLASHTTVEGGIIYAHNSRLTIRDSTFHAVGGQSFLGIPVINNVNWRDFHAENLEFRDFGALNGVSYIFPDGPDGWIKLGNVAATVNSYGGGYAYIKNILSDEGGNITFQAKTTDGSQIKSVIIDGWRANNGVVQGFNFSNVKRVILQNSTMAYQPSPIADGYAAVTAADIETLEIKNSNFLFNSNAITIGARVQEVRIINTVYTYLNNPYNSPVEQFVNANKLSSIEPQRSIIGRGITYQDSTTNRLRASLNGSPYFNVVGGSFPTSLSDNFNTGSRDVAKWNLLSVVGVTTAQTGGNLVITPTDGAPNGISGYESVNSYDFTSNGIAMVHAVQSAAGSAGGPSILTQLGIIAGADSYKISHAHYNGSLIFYSSIGGVPTETILPLVSEGPTYADTQWWRILYNKTTNQILFETSPNNITWTTRRTVTPNAVTLASVKFNLVIDALFIGTISAPAKFDNFSFVQSYLPLLTDDGKTVNINGILSQTEGESLLIMANTIIPTHSIHHVGGGLIKNIVLPIGFVSGSFYLIPDVAFTYDATGNIVGTGTAVINRVMIFTCSSSSSKCYASY